MTIENTVEVDRMRERIRMAQTLLVLVLAFLAPAQAPADKTLDDALTAARQTELVFEDLANRVTPAVVSIRRFVNDSTWWVAARERRNAPGGWQAVSLHDVIYPGKRPTGGGSGFFISKDGYIFTLHRVVVEPGTGVVADTLDVQINEEHYGATLAGMEPTIDLAILKIVPKAPTPFLRLGDSSKARAGQWAIAFGDPDGSEKTLLPGLVSHKPDRECYQDELSATYLQTSMRVGDQALGGPLVNLQGEVIGITTRRSDAANPEAPGKEASSGYALPINLATVIYRSLLYRTHSGSPWLGISVRALTDELRKRTGVASAKGIYIDNVFDPSPATKAGIQVGDVLGLMDGQPVADVYDFQRKLYELGVGSTVKLELLRGRKRLEVAAVITARPPDAMTR